MQSASVDKGHRYSLCLFLYTNIHIKDGRISINLRINKL